MKRPLIKVLFLLVLIAISLNFCYAGIWESYSRIGIDFDAYYHWEKYIGVYPPFWWLFMAPWRLLPYPIAKNLWVTLNLILLFFLFWTAFQWMQKQQNWDKQLTFWFISFLLISIFYFYPLIVTLQTGQVNLLLLFLLSLSFWYYLKNKKTLTAVLLGLTIS
ncbi:MAG: glycosyltransferase 87 family protein, partial [bacterium]|nr:glycosyltransferase 87 family protein [bacterium]